MATKRKAATGRPKEMRRTAAEIAADALRTGRPALAADKVASRGVTMRLTPAELKRFAGDAGRLGMNLAEYLRHCWRTARKGICDGEAVSQSGQAEKPRNRKTGKRG